MGQVGNGGQGDQRECVDITQVRNEIGLHPTYGMVVIWEEVKN